MRYAAPHPPRGNGLQRSVCAFLAIGEGGDAIGRFFNARGDIFNLSARNGFIEGPGDKTHHR